MPRYVILEHDWNGVHYDLMLECNGVLITWKLCDQLQSGLQSAVKLPDHRLDYLIYEGSISGNRGSVRRVAAGSFQLNTTTDVAWNIVLQGSLQGSMQIVHQVDEQWLLKWIPNSA